MHTTLLILVITGMVLSVVRGLDVDCYKEDFDNSYGIIDKVCSSNFQNFKLESYANNPDLSAPSYSNGYYIAAEEGYMCMETSQQLEILGSSEIELNIFTRNPNNERARLIINILEGAATIGVKNENIDNSAEWRTISISVFRSTPNAVIRLQSDDLTENGAFVAIDYIKIREPGAQDCLFNGTETTTVAPTTTAAPDTTTAGPDTTTEGQGTTTTVPETTTEAQGTTTSGPETTTEGQGTTTAAPDTTTEGQGTTTSGPETTTEGQGTTTSGPETTTEGQGTTTSGPETTTEGQGTTTAAPDTTTEGQGTTTAGPETTTEAQGTTTSGPDTTTEGLGTTTPIPDTTTEAQGTTTSGPETTTDGQGTTTPIPDTTTEAQGTTTPIPDTTTGGQGTTPGGPETTPVPEPEPEPEPSETNTWEIVSYVLIGVASVFLVYSIVITVFCVKGMAGGSKDVIPYSIVV